MSSASRYGVKTRSSATSSPVKSTSAEQHTVSVTEHEAPKLFILPRKASPEARFILLNDPRNKKDRRYYYCPQLGLHEVTRVNTPQIDTRSVLLAPSTVWNYETKDGDPENSDVTRILSPKVEVSENDPVSTAGIAGGYVRKIAEVFIATPVDTMFILLALFCSAPSNARDGRSRSLFQPLDDLLEDPLNRNKHLKYMLDKDRPRIERALQAVCDTVDSDEKIMYRFSEERVLSNIFSKAQRLVDKGLPSSLEEKFVTRALEKPILSVKREETAVLADAELVENVVKGNLKEVGSSQSSTGSSFTLNATSEISSFTPATTISDQVAPVHITYLQRLRTAIAFITSSYVPPNIADKIQEHLSSKTSPVDFRPLDEYLTCLATLRAEAIASVSLSDFSRKRRLMDDENASELRAEKKRKQEEEEKRKKAGESRAVRDLKKVNVAGMKKMSDFFIKKPTVARTKS